MIIRWILGMNLLYWAGFAAQALLLAGVCGCAPSPKVQAVWHALQSQDAESRAWDEGMKAFEKGEYDKAAAVFEALGESAENPGLSRKALYALASTRLILANTPAEFNEAVVLWDCWSQQVSAGFDGEDPRMLTPFFERLGMPLGPGSGVSKAGKAERSVGPVNPVAFKNLLQAKEKEIERIKSRLDAKEKEVRRLRTQIDTLEAIHRKFQERKQEVSTP